MEEWRRDMLRRGLAGKTIAQRLSIIRRFVRWLDRPAISASEEEIQSFLDFLRIGMATRSIYLGIFASFFRWARRAGYVKADPTDDIVRPRIPRRLPRPMPEADLDWALQGADARMRCWLLLANYAGLRCMEIAGLWREHVHEDLAPPFLEITGKGGHERMVPINPLLEEALRSYGLPRSGPMFPSPRTGRPYTPSTVSNLIAEYLHGKGLRWTAHNGRHAFGTAIEDLTGDPVVVKELLGHASLATVTLYTKYNQKKAVAAVQALGIHRSEPVRLPGI